MRIRAATAYLEQARPALGYWVKEGVGLVVHFSLEDVAKINTP
jgi:hypothetical protein